MSERHYPHLVIAAVAFLASCGGGGSDAFSSSTPAPLFNTCQAIWINASLNDLLAKRERLTLDVQKILDAQTDTWGIKVTNVEIKHVDLNDTMIRAIVRQAEAERERRAKVIHAEGVFPLPLDIIGPLLQRFVGKD